MTEKFLILSELLIPFIRVMEAHGLDSSVALQKIDIDPLILKEKNSRISADKFTKVLDYCIHEIGSNDVSIRVAKQFHAGMFDVLGYAMMSSNTLQDALGRIAQYKRVVSNTSQLSVIESDSSLVFDMDIFTYEDNGRQVLSRELTETFLVVIVQFSRNLIGQLLVPKKVVFSYPKPHYDTQYLTDFFQCDLEYDKPTNQIIFDLKQANIQLLGSNPLITQTHEKLLDEFLKRINKDDLSHVVITKICDVLPLGAPSQTDVAQQLNMSLRNLQRKLHDQGTSFKEILENTRKKLTLNYIAQKDLSLSEISYLVGFSSTSNFNRAFKRWTGKTPGEYRSQQLNIH